MTFAAAMKWLEKQKKNNLNMDNYVRFHNEAEENVKDARSYEYEAKKLSNSIGSLKNGIIAARHDEELADGLVDIMNEKVLTHRTVEATKQECVDRAEKAARNIENYDSWDRRELFFFYKLMKDMFPDKMPKWIEFEQSNEDYYHRNNYDKNKLFEDL